MVMRIILVTDQYHPMTGGVPTVVQQLATNLAARGHRVWVLAPSSTSHNEYALEQKVRVYRFASFEWPIYEGQRVPLWPFTKMYRLLTKIQPDIIHIHSPIVMGTLALLLGRHLHKPIIATNHYLPVNTLPALASAPIIGTCIRLFTGVYLTGLYNRCTFITSPTLTGLKLLHTQGLRRPSAVISNGIDLHRFSPGLPMASDPLLRTRLHLPETHPLILHVNRLSSEKRVEVLLRTIPLVQSDAHFVLVGAGPDEKRLRTLASQLGVTPRVSFLGYMQDEDLLALRREATLFVIPSEAELQSLSTMEAMACGLPVIAAHACALPELVRHGENGLLFTPGQSDELAHHVDTLLQDDYLRTRMGQRSLQIIARHTHTDVLASWEQLYASLALPHFPC